MTTQAPTTAIQRTNGNTAPVRGAQEAAPEERLREYLARPAVVDRLKAVASKYMRPEELIRLTLIAASRTPKIATCTPESVLRCLMEAAALGIRPGGIQGRGWLVPRWNKHIRCNELTFDPGWRGLADVARRSGVVQRIEAHPVYARDAFRVVMGSSPRLEHEPYQGDADRGEIVAAYAVAFFREGDPQFEVVPKIDLDRIRAASTSKEGDDNPWTKWPDEMSRKSAVKRLCKYLPYDEELEAAMDAATRAEIGEMAVVPTMPQVDAQPRAKALAERIRPRQEAAPAHEPEHAEAPASAAPEPPVADADSPPPEDWQPGADHA